ncbi:uncharacterized protein LOC115221498 isoform X2 [Octopus sinensis]|uniref:Dynein regulatory complex protein 12 n=1 Tax=Octopus sinensis TaxID=2607531 RepID=A0A6P7TB48_9MOLL|nr:uncharacterized protein LOC115221498 isoform X2 [Octopus sinensis]
MSTKKKAPKMAKKPSKKNVLDMQAYEDRQKEEKFQNSIVELNNLKEYLAQRHSLLVKSVANRSDCHKRLNMLRVELETQKGDYKSVSEEMKRQYKTMESEMSVKVHLLETKLACCKQKLRETEAKLLSTRAETMQHLKEKQKEIDLLHHKQNSIQSFYEKIIHRMEE